MQFQKYLKRNVYVPYKYNYLDYERLRSALKGRISNDEDERRFLTELQDDVDRVFRFIESKGEELVRKLNILEKKPVNETKLRIKKLMEEMRNFAEFIRINTAGFKNILRKHDRETNYKLFYLYKSLLKEKVKSMKNLDDLMYKASKISLRAVDANGSCEDTSTFIRRTDKYWVHRDNIIPLKFYIVQHLPIYVFSKEDGCSSPYNKWNKETHDTCISSVYFDNASFDLYEERLKKLHHSEAIRIRWYTSKTPDVVFIERKRHEDGWTGEASKKLRFKLSERFVLDFINGKDVWKNVKELNEDEDIKKLYEEIQSSITSKKLRPVVRTFYKRNAFQFPSDSSVRISLDTDLCMIRECSDTDILDPLRPITSWKRKDVGCEFPFKNIPKEEIVRFPHAILEIKTQSFNDEKPKWIEDLIGGPLVEHVHKFSKYLHGCAVLYPFIREIPYWLPQISVDIRKNSFPENGDRMSSENVTLVDIPVESDPSNSEKISPMQIDDRSIAIPIRVEPKVFFANERTFLSWIQFAIFLGGVGSALLSLGDERARIPGLILILAAVILSFYSLYLYLWRVDMIKNREAGPYDDFHGPVILVCIFFIAMGLSIFFRFPLKRN